MKLIRHVEEIPFDHYVSEQIHISPIDVEALAGAEAIVEDITSHSSPGNWREKAIAGLWVYLKTGERSMMSPETFRLALKGGGDFYLCYPNGEYDEPITLAEHEARLEREAEEAFWDYY